MYHIMYSQLSVAKLPVGFDHDVGKKLNRGKIEKV